jgi:hypothetical protein
MKCLVRTTIGFLLLAIIIAPYSFAANQTRTQLQSQINSVPWTNNAKLITGAELQSLYQNILDSTFITGNTSLLQCSLLTCIFSPSVIGGATLNITPGVAPTLPNNGDIWMTATGLFAQINGGTVNLAPKGDFRTLQSFGAVGDGVADDTLAISTAFNSGEPLTCNGTFVISSLVTITDKQVYMQGSGGVAGGGLTGHDGFCQFNLTTATSGFYFNLAQIFYPVTIKDAAFVPMAVITSNGAPHTAALDIEYPLGTVSVLAPSIDIERVSIIPNLFTNYITTGIYINDGRYAFLEDISYMGFRNGGTAGIVSGTSAIVIDGTHTPAGFWIKKVIVNYADMGVYAPQETAAGWQAIYIDGMECDFMNYCVRLLGSADGTSAFVDITQANGNFLHTGIHVENANEILLHKNLLFMLGTMTTTTPACYEIFWGTTIPSYGVDIHIDGNFCDGLQAAGAGLAKFGYSLGATTATYMNAHIGVNELSNLDVGGTIFGANLTGVSIERQQMKNVTTEITDSSTPGQNFFYPPMAVINGTTAPLGLVGEVKSAVVAIGAPVALVSATPKDVTTLALTPGHWTCYGSLGFLPNAATTITALSGGISTVANTMPASNIPEFFYNLPFTAGMGNQIALPTATYNPIVNTTLHLVAASTFAVNTQAAYGNIECQRTE